MTLFVIFDYNRENANYVHQTILDSLMKWIDVLGGGKLMAEVVKDNDVTDEHMTDKDLCISIGGKIMYIILNFQKHFH